MAFHRLRHTILFATLARLSAAQQSSKIIPQDLQAGLADGTPLQVSYTNQAINGFTDGTSFSKDAVAKEPTFALGDSAGISPLNLYTIIMVDTTCPDKRVLHYVRANFKNNFDITNIDTKSAALVDYKSPGSFGETGDNRQYSFLMYDNAQRKEITSLKLPGEGEAFDVAKFQSDNGFQDATGGVGMVVKLGGQADCGGSQPAPSNAQSAAPPRSSAANVGSTSSVAGASSAPRVTATSTSTGPRASSAANASATSSSSPNNPSNDNGDAPASSGARTSSPAAASSDVQSEAPAMSTVVLSSAGPEGGIQASGTPSASPAQQTASSALILSANGYNQLASILVIAGLVMW